MSLNSFLSILFLSDKMVEYGNVDNPTLDVKEFKMGDFAYLLLNDTQPSFAVVTDVNKDFIRLRHFEDGFPFKLSRTPANGSVRKATIDEALKHFKIISKELGIEFERGGLSGVIAARRQHYLNGIISQLKEEGRDTFYAATINPPDPLTGRYVLMGIYSGQGESEHLEGLATAPRLAEKTVSSVMMDICPKGFGKIPSDVYNTPATSHGSLVTYHTFEVPKKALGLVRNPKKLKLSMQSNK